MQNNKIDFYGFMNMLTSSKCMLPKFLSSFCYVVTKYYAQNKMVDHFKLYISLILKQ